ncbi:nucleotidyl transferase [Alkalispirochaeta odontotermitis]|nr:nucleotidyl transferase [Alkalispirochaeta odontotermitis]CAB1084212.1 hypothetical protein D1AOALGA4SA_11739 [Olavius algarvensis Delta 1 endosymbiont]
MVRLQHAIIMAAGRGMRMMPLTQVVPKPMAPYQDTTLIADGIKKIRKSIPHIYITVGYKGPKLAAHVIDYGVAGVFNTSGRGNAWWIYNTLLKYLDEPLIVLTCDNVVSLDINELEREYEYFDQPACMLVPVKPVPGLDGDYIRHDRNLVLELSREKPTDSYCSGIQIINPNKINRITRATEDFYHLWNELIEKKEVYASRIFPKQWFAVDTIEQLSILNGESVA